MDGFCRVELPACVWTEDKPDGSSFFPSETPRDRHYKAGPQPCSSTVFNAQSFVQDERGQCFMGMEVIYGESLGV
jgi:hypothetical protein